MTQADSTRPIIRYAVAAVATAAAVALRAALDPWLGNNLALITLYAAIAAAVWVGGAGPAILAAAIGYIGCNLLFVGTRGVVSLETGDLIGLAAYTVSAGAIIALGEGLRRTRQRLTTQHATLDRIVSSIDDHFVMIDNEWRYVYVNQRMVTDGGGYTRDQLIGGVIWDLYPSLMHTEFEAVARAAVADRKPRRAMIFYPKRDQWLEVQFYPSLSGLAILSRDVTPQRATESALAQRVTELDALYQFSERLQHASSIEQVCTAAFDAMHVALGADRASILLFDEHDVMRFVAWRGLSDAYRAAVDGHSPWKAGENNAEPIWTEDIATAELEEWLLDRIMSENIRSLGFVPLISSGTLIGKFMIYHADVHARQQQEIDVALTIARQLAFSIERLRVEEGRRNAVAALSEASRRKDEFLTTLAHELRNPLAPIVNGLAILREEHIDAKVRATSAAVIDRQVRQLVRLVDDLLDIGRIDHDRLELRRQRTAIATVINQAVETCRPMIDAARHRLSVVEPEESLFVDGDPIRLAQVMGNLLNNACKYTERDGIIEITTMRDNADAVITVRDNGLGIPAEKLDHVFELFAQLDTAIDRSNGGLGIGLTLVRRLVEMHGGTVTASSSGVGAGSEFTVRLPLALSEADVVDGATRATPVVRQRRVLVVDDNVDAAQSLAILLQMRTHQVETAHDGESAIAAAERFRPEVILLDIGLPKGNGFEVCRAIRAQDGGTGVQIFALTGWGQEEFRNQSSDAGFDAHLVKPIDFAQLETLIAERPSA